MKPQWLPDWRGKPTVLVASGPGAKGVSLELARGRCFVGCVNKSWELAPWADALYAADYGWWESVGGCQEFKGLKITCDERAARNWGLRHIKHRRGDERILVHQPGTVGGKNSGQQLLDISIQAGSRFILLVGYDMTLSNGVHWHGEHGKRPDGQKLGNPRDATVKGWRKALDAAARTLEQFGVTVINCSPVSALTAFKKMGFEEAMSLALAECASPS